MHDDDGTHQDQVKVLIDKTADSLDNLALKMLFVSIQQNNLNLSIRYAINLWVFSELIIFYSIYVFTVFFRLKWTYQWFVHQAKSKILRSTEFLTGQDYWKMLVMVPSFILC